MQVRHCLDVHGTALSDGGDTGSATPSGAGVAAYALDRRKVCLHFARKLLQQGPPGGSSATGSRWLRPQLLEAWAAAVPEEWSPPEPGLLVGEALEELPEGAVQGELSLRLLSTQVWAPTSGHATETLFRCMQGKLLPPSIRLPPPAVRAGSEPTVVPFAARDLPLEPAARFAALFARQPRWQRRVRGPAALLVLQGPLATVLLGCRRGAQRSAAPLPTQY